MLDTLKAILILTGTSTYLGEWKTYQKCLSVLRIRKIRSICITMAKQTRATPFFSHRSARRFRGFVFHLVANFCWYRLQLQTCSLHRITFLFAVFFHNSFQFFALSRWQSVVHWHSVFYWVSFQIKKFWFFLRLCIKFDALQCNKLISFCQENLFCFFHDCVYLASDVSVFLFKALFVPNFIIPYANMRNSPKVISLRAFLCKKVIWGRRFRRRFLWRARDKTEKDGVYNGIVHKADRYSL